MDNENAEQYRTGSRVRGWRNDPELVRVHHTALTVVCRYCFARVGEVCVRPDDPNHPALIHLPCHPVRETDSTKGPKQL